MHKTIRTCTELLENYIKCNSSNNSSKNTEKLHFLISKGEDRDVYNISAPFNWKGETLLAGRVEARDSEDSEVIFFTQTDKTWAQREGYPVLKLQDPFITQIKGELIIGGVEIYPDPEDKSKLAYRTIFYKGDALDNLARFTAGPERMKDIRLKELPDGRILVFTRPQGELGGRGKIGYIIIDKLEDLNSDKILQAKILEHQFIEEEWGGVNEVHLLENGKVGALAHIARFDEEGNRHYYSSSFCFEPETGNYSPMKLIAVREDFEPGASKRPDLQDVIFSGGIIRLAGGQAELFCGVSDAEAHSIIIPDPFLEWEI